eukprot:TRINITY_DN1501_c0_g2_i2.p1 TRINITY_DN1501_c0_g2~~TRINITY_DN1501_c0_g2_i2.p1  ORF type:complete len:408 (-),score=112.79 TRINITY_DN1501_c0_g2_i2:162-1385(-)
MSLQEELNRISYLERDLKQNEYLGCLEKLYKNQNQAELEIYIEHVCDPENNDPMVMRTVIEDLATNLSTKIEDQDEFEELGELLDQKLRDNMSYEKESKIIREKLVDRYIYNEDYDEAASMMASITSLVDNSRVFYHPEEKIRVFLKCCQLYIKLEDNGRAQEHLNRANSILDDAIIEKHPELHIIKEECLAQVQDFNKKFYLAASRYYELTHLYDSISFEEKMNYLKGSLLCAILAPAAQNRIRLLNTLYHDERTSKYPELYQMLEKMHLQHIISSQESKQFEKHLKVHHLAILSDGSTFWDKAVMEHNLYSASRLYKNISFEQLGFLLDITSEKAEKAAATLITEKRMKGSIDQINQIIKFDHDNASIPKWDKHIETLCSSVNEITEIIVESHPEQFKIYSSIVD